MSKLRVYDLAKQYGKKGPEMAEILRSMGFTVKGHMSVLDEADQMMAVARLEAGGLRPAGGDSDNGGTASTGLKKKTLVKKALPGEGLRKKLPAKKGLKSTDDPDTGAEDTVAAEIPDEVTEDVAAETPDEVSAEPEAEKTETPEPDTSPDPEEAAAASQPTETSESAAATGQEAAVDDDAAGSDETGDGESQAGIKRLIQPQQKATVVGKIQLPESTIRDANRRSAPRDPNSVDHALRAKALSHTQSRSATRAGGIRRGPGRGPHMRGRGRDQRGTMRRNRGASSISSTIDPNKEVEIQPPITVKGLSEALGVKVSELIQVLMGQLKIVGKTINSFLDPEEVELIALELERKIKIVEQTDVEEELLEGFSSAVVDIESEHRAPVLTFMGHVDHGKTTLLDALRQSDVVKGEAGGITQHIGAYRVTTKNDSQFVVLDTPGHAAFTSMRARGASLTDIVVLVVAADDGVMPQTEEAVNHALQGKVPIIVAVNKCDAPGANPMQVRQQLSVKGLQAEEWGGSVQMIDVSALTGQGLDDLVEKIMLEAELLELEAKSEAPGSGIVIESRQSANQGVVVSVLVTDGTLHVRDMMICGESYSRVRGMVDDHGNSLTEAGPSTPVSIIGLAKLPTPGDKFLIVKDAKKAKEVVEERQRRARANDLADRSRITAENLAAKLRDQQIDELKVVLKADVMGSLEPIRNSLADIGTDEVRVNVIHKGLGAVTENDVVLAEASEAIVIAFNTITEQAARQTAERVGVEIRQYEIIYKLLDDMRDALEGMLKPDEVETIEGHAEIRAIFKSSKHGNISGCFITDGLVNRNHHARVTRDGTIVYRGKIASLRRIDDDVREVKEGYECGLTVTNFNDVKVGDVLEFFSVNLVARKLD
ncbi:MAG: translation initiation factor IF-2 [Planctomycetota bacterium]|nr:translation initiation factor IF-2 [Planctomycetota bacterium]